MTRAEKLLEILKSYSTDEKHKEFVDKLYAEYMVADSEFEMEIIELSIAGLIHNGLRYNNWPWDKHTVSNVASN